MHRRHAEEIRRLIQFDSLGEERLSPTPAEPPQATHTVREPVRRSVPTGGSEQARSNVMQQLLQGGQPNSQQMGMMGREKAI